MSVSQMGSFSEPELLAHVLLALKLRCESVGVATRQLILSQTKGEAESTSSFSQWFPTMSGHDKRLHNFRSTKALNIVKNSAWFTDWEVVEKPQNTTPWRLMR